MFYLIKLIDFKLKFQTIAEKTANKLRGPLFAAPCTYPYFTVLIYP